MASDLSVDICVIGAGSGGLSVAAGASQLGASTVLVERDKLGGDCLNTGCVPSKAMLAAAHAAEAVRRAGRFGIRVGAPEIDPAGVYGHVQGVIAAIQPMDSVERFEGLGVQVIQDTARFTGPRQIVAGGTRISARRFVIATGSSPFAPPIRGLDQVAYYTNENIFEADALPEHLIVIGGGPIGIELAQAHRHLGARVTVLEMLSIMPNDDPELVGIVRGQLIDDGIDIREGVSINRIEKTASGVRVLLDDCETPIDGSHLLVAAGRRANVENIGLDDAGIRYSARGIEVDARMRTSDKKVFAIGDVAGGLQFTHVAGYHAGIVIKNALFRIPAKANMRGVPWVTYCAPELAQVGMTETAARAAGHKIKVLRWPFHDNDRSLAEGQAGGLVKAITTAKGKILGCGIVGAHAGELIHTWVLAIGQNIKIGGIAQMISPYPTRGEVSKRAASSYYTPSLFSEKTRRIVGFLRWFG